MEVELVPPQDPAIEAIVAALLERPTPEPDPWWQAGIDQALDTEPRSA